MICGNGKEHDRYSWCGLEFTIEEQGLLASYLLGLWIHKHDTYAKDMFDALSEMVTKWKPNHFKIDYPLDRSLTAELKRLLEQCQKCCIPHSTIYSASSCPSCCLDDLVKGCISETSKIRQGDSPEVSPIAAVLERHLEAQRAIQGVSGIQRLGSSDESSNKS